MVVNMADAMRRNLQRFVEQDLAGVVRWDEVHVRVPASGEGEVVEIEFDVGPEHYLVAVSSSDAKPPLGEVAVNLVARGPIDEGVWRNIAEQIKAIAARTAGDLNG
jgi:hypothetical protein